MKPGAMARVFLTTLIILCLPPAVLAQDGSEAPRRALDLLDQAMNELDAPPPGKDQSEEALLDQNEGLRETLRQMKNVLDDKMLAIKQLEDENEKLRQALRLRFGQRDGKLPPVPMPNRDLIESVLNEPGAVPERQETLNAADAKPEAYTIVSEWGRSPEVAASLPGEVSSLIGMAVAVPSDMTEDNLVQLGNDLRQNYDAYDNINIEVFDDLEAARRYANEGSPDGNHRVMTIAKFKHSERDSIVVYRQGKAMEVP